MAAPGARAMRYLDERRALLKDRMALAMLDAQTRNVGLPALAEASGYSVANVRLEMNRARKMNLSDAPG